MKSKKMSEIDKIYEAAAKCKYRKTCYGNSSIELFIPKPDKDFGRKNIAILFINERPGPKTRKTRLISPDNPDPTAKRFSEILKPLKISKQKYFSTNACLCIPQNGEGDKSPSGIQITNCSEYLKKQIELLNPKLIIPLGNCGRRALCKCLKDSETLNKLKRFRLGRNVGETFELDGFIVYPLYHTSQRNLWRRSNKEQKKDWEKIRDLLKNRRKK